MLKQTFKMLSFILLNTIIASMTRLQAQVEENNDKVILKKPKTEVFNMPLRRGHKNDRLLYSINSNIPEEIRSNLFKNIQDFDGTGPHKLNIYMLGGILGNFKDDCNILIDAIDRKTRQVHIALLSSAELPNYISQSESKSDTVSINIDKINYRFIVEKCPSGWISNEPTGKIRIERTIVENTPPITDNLIWKMSGKLKRTKKELRIVTVDWAAEKPLNAEISNSRDIGFEFGSATSKETSTEISSDLAIVPGFWEIGGAIHTQLGVEVNKAEEEKFEQIKTESEGINLIGNLCKKHLVWKIEVSEYGQVSAPKLGFTEWRDFTVLRAFFYESRSLCDEKSGSNEPIPELVEQANQEISSFNKNRHVLNPK